MTLIENVFPNIASPKKVIRLMSVKFRFRGAFEKKYRKKAQRHLKSGQRCLYHIC